MEEILEQLILAAGKDRVKTMEPMGPHVTFRAGGKADYFVTPENESGLAGVLKVCSRHGLPFYLMGNGSNLLVGDLGYHGVIIQMGDAWGGCRFQGNTAEAGAGILLSRLAKEACRQGLTGLEAAGGIPGTLGGALVMNAGAYGFEMKDVVRSARLMTESGEILELSAEELQLGYRTSCIPARHLIVLGARLELAPGNREEIRARMEELTARRKEKQPLEYPSAGSTFKRPEGYFAGKLIEDAGLRGYRVGGAQVSEKHCGFVINRGGATAGDIMKLCRDVQRTVKEKFGVTLEMEVRTLGEFEEPEEGIPR
ncbi:MAG TPA: UDP-N-acetylmuramate dehydrogenase [Candidatus Lachnoclostridium pullistercoris]|uniref:UDP-N-acetylenolpyruvoylglucosamine reductase n=1 Tax=Candidatus Lachnoclostridium pullistercoris TaxID=2838632 RepID=A0A9D2PDB4_9FIRM|nr:UDP-N-acetylmuramate dehydrogenase [Candidatus Lachnoclostridium pullistercoris]